MEKSEKRLFLYHRRHHHQCRLLRNELNEIELNEGTNIRFYEVVDV
jgi:hypothetical protein